MIKHRPRSNLVNKALRAELQAMAQKRVKKQQNLKLQNDSALMICKPSGFIGAIPF